ncbi:MAG TPA: 50S ribosomal protein L25 [Bacillota bacterium]|nr:50S ribosomal protein L25 [Bacillota bacterium]
MRILDQEVILARTREVGTGAAKALRRNGQVPAILYGKDIDSVPIALDSKEMRKILSQSMGHVHKIKVEGLGLEGSVMVQAIDRDPITGNIIHIDLHKISMTDVVKVEVPVIVVGEEKLAEQGLVLERLVREISVECLPGDIPNEFVIDVSDLQVGDTILVGEIEVPEGVKITTPPDEVVVVVSVPRMVLEEEEEEEEELEIEILEGEEVDEPEEL